MSLSTTAASCQEAAASPRLRLTHRDARIYRPPCRSDQAQPPCYPRTALPAGRYRSTTFRAIGSIVGRLDCAGVLAVPFQVLHVGRKARCVLRMHSSSCVRSRRSRRWTRSQTYAEAELTGTQRPRPQEHGVANTSARGAGPKLLRKITRSDGLSPLQMATDRKPNELLRKSVDKSEQVKKTIVR